jgi:hypothetical protein
MTGCNANHLNAVEQCVITVGEFHSTNVSKRTQLGLFGIEFFLWGSGCGLLSEIREEQREYTQLMCVCSRHRQGVTFMPMIFCP